MGRRQLWLVLAWLASLAVQLRAETIIWPMEALNLAKQRALSLECCEHLKQLGLMAKTWANDNADRCPPDLRTFIDFSASPAVLSCPENSARPGPTNWADVDWTQVDYEWIPVIGLGNFDADPTAICCRCRVHEHVLFADGSVHPSGGWRPGWPAIIASPLRQDVTPGSAVRFEVRIAPDAQAPVVYQWRRESLYFVTNIISFPNPDDPHTLLYLTNRSARFAAAPLPGQTNRVCLLSNVESNDAGYYSVAVSNELGVAVCAPALVHVDTAVASMAADEAWSQRVCVNNLNQLALFAKLWAADHGDKLPEDWKQMTNAFGLPMFGWPVALHCPSDSARMVALDWAAVDLADTSYELPAANPEDPFDIFGRCKIHGFYAQMNGEILLGPRFDGIRLATNHAAEVSFRPFAGRTNVLEASSDLLTWTNVRVYDSQHGPVVFADTNSSVQRFYRLRLR